MKRLTYYLLAFAITVLRTVTVYSQKEPLPPPPPPKPPKVAMKEAGPTVTIDQFYKTNPPVSRVYPLEEKKIMIERKDGTREKYNLNDQIERKNLLNKYGALPLVPPPPPPPPPKKVT
jgi:hypothetical protein